MWVEPRPSGRGAPEPGDRRTSDDVFLFMFETQALDKAGVQNVNRHTVPGLSVVSYCKTSGNSIATQLSLLLFFLYKLKGGCSSGKRYQ